MSCPPLSLPLLCPVPGSPGGGARGAAGGAAGGSGAALAHAPGPGAVQLPRPQLALLRARPCTSLLNWPGGVARRLWRSRPPQAPPPAGPALPRHFRFLFPRWRASRARPFPHTWGPFPGGVPPIQPHTRPRTPASRALVPALDPLSLGCPLRTWSPHLCPHYYPRSRISSVKPFRIFWTGPDTPLSPARQVLQCPSLVDLSSALHESDPSPPDFGVLLADPASDRTPRGCSLSRLHPPPTPRSPEPSGGCPHTPSSLSLSLVLAWASQEAVA